MKRNLISGLILKDLSLHFPKILTLKRERRKEMVERLVKFWCSGLVKTLFRGPKTSFQTQFTSHNSCSKIINKEKTKRTSKESFLSLTTKNRLELQMFIWNPLNRAISGKVNKGTIRCPFLHTTQKDRNLKNNHNLFVWKLLVKN